MNSSTTTCGHRLLLNHVNHWCSSRVWDFFFLFHFFIYLFIFPETTQIRSINNKISIRLSQINSKSLLMWDDSWVKPPNLYFNCLFNYKILIPIFLVVKDYIIFLFFFRVKEYVILVVNKYFLGQSKNIIIKSN